MQASEQSIGNDPSIEMKMSGIDKTEDIIIKHFITSKMETGINTVTITVGLGLGGVATQAMLKGLIEHYFKPMGSSLEGVDEVKLDATLAKFKEHAQRQRSGLIIP